jgi:hypothetical protein
MTPHFIKQTAATSDASEPRTDPSVATSPSSEHGALGSRSGLFLAGLVLWAALITAGTAGTIPEGYTRRRRDETTAESSTADVERDPELLNQVKRLFEQGASEFFQDGMYSAFSRALLVMLSQHGRAAFQAIAEYVFSGVGNADVVSEALRWLADFNDPATLPQRWAILERTLRDQSPRIRDGAILGFGALDDPRARQLLLETQRVEPIPELRRLIQQVIDQLNATDALASSNGSREPLA